MQGSPRRGASRAPDCPWQVQAADRGVGTTSSQVRIIVLNIMVVAYTPTARV